MKIAILAPPLYPIIEDLKYGGIERVIQGLANGLAKLGLEVTIFAPVGSRLGDNRIRFEIYCGSSIKESEKNLFEKIVKEQANFDLIHSFVEPVIAREGSYFYKIYKPLIFSFQNSTRIVDHISYYRRNKWLWHKNFTFLSLDHATPLSFLPNKKIIYNGVDLKKIDYNGQGGSRLIFLGRIMPEKGILEAIQLADYLGLELTIAAKIDDQYYDFYCDKVKKHFNKPNINYIGEVDDHQKNTLLGEALATLCLINWHEPFGLVSVESMAAGTPVVARSMGALPEIVEDGISGILVPPGRPIADCVSNIEQKIRSLKRIDCRLQAEEFSMERMVKEFCRLYSDII